MQVIMAAAYLFFGLVGVGLFILGAMGGIQIRRFGIDVTLAWRQRLTCTAMGVIFVAAAWSLLTGRLPMGE
jgi:hypothetical protein